MAKTIYTDRDIDDLARQGIKELTITDDVYLTDLARERAEKLGFNLRPTQTKVAAPVRLNVPRENTEQLVNQVKADVISKLGSQVDAAVIERIVRRVVGQLEIRN